MAVSGAALVGNMTSTFRTLQADVTVLRAENETQVCYYHIEGILDRLCISGLSALKFICLHACNM